MLADKVSVDQAEAEAGKFTPIVRRSVTPI